ncbi:MAG: M20/M25/M40 family metallo-hydrolase [Bacteroidales bacterium]|nr:M20/M25/M40 family metallo-hydrolase [Bacteroidales bacterium]
MGRTAWLERMAVGAALLTGGAAWAAPASDWQPADTLRLRQAVEYIASERMAGRLTGSAGDSLTADYIAGRFAEAGLMALENGQTYRAGMPPQQVYWQSYRMRASWGDSLSTRNVVGLVPGTDAALQHRYIVLGAHFDHLGMGDKAGSLRPDPPAVHYGADDNASGVAALLELADYFAAHPVERTLVFVAFSGEEIGLCGSTYFVEHLPVPQERIDLMVNMDMLGGLCDTVFTVSGAGTAREAAGVLEHVGEGSGLKVDTIAGGHGPSDHAAFYAREIPVFFFATPPTQRYHTPDDRPETLCYEGMARLLHVLRNTVKAASRVEGAWHFTSTGSAAPTMTKGKFKVTLGLMPDINATADGREGLKAMLVVEGKPAYKAGLRTGDRLLRLNGVPLHTIEEYMQVLGTLQAGETVELEAECGVAEGRAERKTLRIQL